MSSVDTYSKTQPTLEIIKQESGDVCVSLSGDWALSNLMSDSSLQKNIKQASNNKEFTWDLRSINILDNATALWLWRAWGQKTPAGLKANPEHLRLINKWHSQALPDTNSPGFSVGQAVAYLSQKVSDIFGQLLNFIALLGQLLLDIGHLLLHPGDTPWSEISITIYDAGVRALGITALVGFLIGIVLSYLSALQLKLFGAEIYIIDILGLSVIRELGRCLPLFWSLAVPVRR